MQARDDDVLPSEVAARIGEELGDRGSRVLACLRTARDLLSRAEDDSGLRLAESAAYNVREALDSVVAGRPAGEGGVPEVAAAWKRYELASLDGAVGDPDALAELHAVIGRIVRDEQRQSDRALKLLSYIQDQTGVEPLPGEADPIIQFTGLLGDANSMLHEDGTVAQVAVLLDDTIAWLIRFFTPPDERILALTSLAQRRYEPGLIDELRRLAINAHHLRHFLTRLTDFGWLEPLRDAELLVPPVPNQGWPLAGLLSSTLDPSSIATVLGWMSTASRDLPGDRGVLADREILRVAAHLGTSAKAVAVDLIRRRPGDHWMHVFAIAISREVDADDPAQFHIADAVIGNEPSHERFTHAKRLLDRLEAGLTSDNVRDRMAMIGAKLRREARSRGMRYAVIEPAGLHVEADHDWELPVVLARYFVRWVPRARELGVSSSELLAMVDGTQGELGERLVCRIVAGAPDVDRHWKVEHVAVRLNSHTVTGDDLLLVDDILAVPLSDDEVSRWHDALGVPSQPTGPDHLPSDWARAWRWSVVMPASVLHGWEGSIAAVTTTHGGISRAAIETPVPRFQYQSGRSPIDRTELVGQPVLEVCSRAAAWRPDASDAWGVSARELAREIEELTKADPQAWSEHPVEVVRSLREPVYVDHYFRGLAETARDVSSSAAALIRSVAVVAAEPWDVTPLGDNSFDYEADWTQVRSAGASLIAGLANASGTFEDELDLAWRLVTSILEHLPEPSDDISEYVDADEHHDPLFGAINSAHGKALEAALALGGWEHRTNGSASDRLRDVLDDALAARGAVGLELRGVIVSRMPFMLTVAEQWLEERATDLFLDDTLGPITFAQSTKWSRPTPWFLDRFRSELAAAARRGAPNAVAWLLLGYLWDVSGYDVASVIRDLNASADALKKAAEASADLVSDLEDGHPAIGKAIAIWRGFIDAPRDLVPAFALVGIGRWTFVDRIPEQTWRELTDQTLAITDGEIDMMTEIAERCAAAPTPIGFRIIRRMLGHGDLWEQQFVADQGVNALRSAPELSSDPEYVRLRSRLIERGMHDATNLPSDHD